MQFQLILDTPLICFVRVIIIVIIISSITIMTCVRIRMRCTITNACTCATTIINWPRRESVNIQHRIWSILCTLLYYCTRTLSYQIMVYYNSALCTIIVIINIITISNLSERDETSTTPVEVRRIFTTLVCETAYNAIIVVVIYKPHALSTFKMRVLMSLRNDSLCVSLALTNWIVAFERRFTTIIDA